MNTRPAAADLRQLPRAGRALPRASAAVSAPSRLASLRRRLIPAGSVDRLAETFRVLGDPTRVRILDALSRQELCVSDLSAVLELGESAVSHQLRLLRSLRLVRPRRAGRLVFYSLDDHHILSLFAQGLEHVEEAAPARGRQRRERAR